jgi:hypothetical protein
MKLSTKLAEERGEKKNLQKTQHEKVFRGLNSLTVF